MPKTGPIEATQALRYDVLTGAADPPGFVELDFLGIWVWGLGFAP